MYAVRTPARTRVKRAHSQAMHPMLPQATPILRPAVHTSMSPEMHKTVLSALLRHAVRPFLNRERAPWGRSVCYPRRRSGRQLETKILHQGTLFSARLDVIRVRRLAFYGVCYQPVPWYLQYKLRGSCFVLNYRFGAQHKQTHKHN